MWQTCFVNYCFQAQEWALNLNFMYCLSLRQEYESRGSLRTGTVFTALSNSWNTYFEMTLPRIVTWSVVVISSQVWARTLFRKMKLLMVATFLPALKIWEPQGSFNHSSESVWQLIVLLFYRNTMCIFQRWATVMCGVKRWHTVLVRYLTF